MNTKRLTLVTKFRAALIRSTSLFLASLAVLLMATMGAPQAYAAPKDYGSDLRVYPGSMCVGHNTTGPFSTDFGAIRNVSGAPVGVVCPVPAADPDKSLRRISGWVRVINASGQPPTNCLLVRDNRSGGQWVGSTVGPGAIDPIGGSDQQLNYPVVWLKPPDHMYYYCGIPNGGSVTSYRVNEYYN